LSVDIVLIDKLISDEILALIPQGTKKVYVGKAKGEHSMKQEEINKLLVDYGKEGLTIARLKSGDPFIFGRGSEEALALVEAGIDVEIVPGISSALAGPSSAGIAPTARGYASALSIVSAHLANNLDNLDWIDLLLKQNHTTIVLMGLSKAQKIKDTALALGVDVDLDVALISNASRINQKTLITTLGELPEKALEVQRPAIMVFGDVVKLHELLPSFKRNKYENITNSL
ncbi:MAG: uroporphyrinogen-III C-methyltransferase, partial [Thiovulaceae bacterium]|nr:uroporphyrinogen-III C-methyltransferase [Sulfurimonadaceae bacterium]